LSENKAISSELVSGLERGGALHPIKKSRDNLLQSSLQMLFGSLAVIVKIIMMTVDP